MFLLLWCLLNLCLCILVIACLTILRLVVYGLVWGWYFWPVFCVWWWHKPEFLLWRWCSGLVSCCGFGLVSLWFSFKFCLFCLEFGVGFLNLWLWVDWCRLVIWFLGFCLGWVKAVFLVFACLEGIFDIYEWFWDLRVWWFWSFWLLGMSLLFWCFLKLTILRR